MKSTTTTKCNIKKLWVVATLLVIWKTGMEIQNNSVHGAMITLFLDHWFGTKTFPLLSLGIRVDHQTAFCHPRKFIIVSNILSNRRAGLLLYLLLIYKYWSANCLAFNTWMLKEQLKKTIFRLWGSKVKTIPISREVESKSKLNFCRAIQE